MDGTEMKTLRGMRETHVMMGGYAVPRDRVVKMAGLPLRSLAKMHAEAAAEARACVSRNTDPFPWEEDEEAAFLAIIEAMGVGDGTEMGARLLRHLDAERAAVLEEVRTWLEECSGYDVDDFGFPSHLIGDAYVKDFTARFLTTTGEVKP